MGMVWDKGEGFGLSRSLHSGVIARGWLDRFAPFFLFLYIYYLSYFPCLMLTLEIFSNALGYTTIEKNLISLLTCHRHTLPTLPQSSINPCSPSPSSNYTLIFDQPMLSIAIFQFFINGLNKHQNLFTPTGLQSHPEIWAKQHSNSRYTLVDFLDATH